MKDYFKPETIIDFDTTYTWDGVEYRATGYVVLKQDGTHVVNIDTKTVLPMKGNMYWFASASKAASEAVFSEEVEQVLNLTQHQATDDQLKAGVVEPSDEEKKLVQDAITFDSIPTAEEIQQRANLVAAIAASTGIKRAMIGGAPFFMSALESALKEVGIQPVYAFSVRDSIEQPDGNGGIKKVNVFRHTGFVEVDNSTKPMETWELYEVTDGKRFLVMGFTGTEVALEDIMEDLSEKGENGKVFVVVKAES